MLVFPQMDPTNSHGFLFGRFSPRGPPAFKIETKQQKHQEEEIQIRVMAALKITGSATLGSINLMIAPLGDT